MKKFSLILLVLVLGSVVLFAAGTKEGVTVDFSNIGTAPVDVRVLAMNGPTAMGMVSLMEEAKKGVMDGNAYIFDDLATIDVVVAKLAKGEVDIAAIPANMASVLFNNTKGALKVLAINTLGVLYIMESGDTVSTIEDLAGKTIFSTGKGASPEYALKYLLNSYGIKDVTIEWKSEPVECVAALAQKANSIAVLPQPFATAAMMKNPSIRIALDMTKLWQDIQGTQAFPSTMMTGVVVGRTPFIAEHPEAVSHFLDHYADSVAYVQSHHEEAASLIGTLGIVPAPVALKALPYCNITFIEGKEMQSKLSGYLTVLYDQNPKSVGGALPTDEFYFKR
ncbi:MAG TPA: ABC transporter substrate-binding protein [Sphaerochaeta sp.]|nr:ABC transporter substrate-binding protein [Sphaerochaeta sp.]